MKIAISGASGFVGRHLSAHLQQQGYEIVPLAHADFADNRFKRLSDIVSACDAVINLAGAPINHRWSRKYQQEIVSSRVDTTCKLVSAVNAALRPEIFISTSAVGYYPSLGCCDERTEARGVGFLTSVCGLWEDATIQLKPRVRRAITRFGVVLSNDGGAFVQMARPAKKGVAIILGSGLQPFSWIDIDDLVRAEEFVLTHSRISGPVNFTAPQELTQRKFMEVVAGHYHARLVVHIPAFIIRLGLGEAADLMLKGQCAIPSQLLRHGFKFNSPTLADFFRRL